MFFYLRFFCHLRRKHNVTRVYQQHYSKIQEDYTIVFADKKSEYIPALEFPITSFLESFMGAFLIDENSFKEEINSANIKLRTLFSSFNY